MPDHLFANLGRVLSDDGGVIGTGVALQGGWFLTCAHVVSHALFGDPQAFSDDCPEGLITFDVGGGPDRKSFKATLDGCIWGPKRETHPKGGGDYALLQITDEVVPHGLTLIADPPVAADPALYAWGFPELDPEDGFQADLELTNRGWAPGARDLVTVKPMPHARDGFIYPGYSGGPVMSGRFPSLVLGIVKSTDIERKERIELAHIVSARTIFHAHSDALQSMRSARLVAKGARASPSAGVDDTAFPAALGPVPCAEKAEARSVEAEVRRLSKTTRHDLGESIAQFLTELEAKKNQIPEPYSQGFIGRRAERLQRLADRIHMLDAARIGEFAYHLLRFSTALCSAAGTQHEDFADLAGTVERLTGALRPEPGQTSAAQGMASDGAWPPGARLAARQAAADVIDGLEPLYADPDHEALAVNIEANAGNIEDQTWLDEPAWAVMAQNAREIQHGLKSLVDGPFADLVDAGADLRQVLLKTQQTVVAALPPGAVFRDLPTSPEMVVIPACPGGFLMGSPAGQEGADPNEKQHEVSIPQKFALARYALTFEEYDAFCNYTGREPPGDKGWGRGRHPAVNVSWEDAVAYCAWLSEQTGLTYRLPSEAEWEYACRGDADGANVTQFCPSVARLGEGAFIAATEANFCGSETFNGSPEGEYRKKTVPVDHPEFRPNGFGLWQMHGNAWEWCEDVYEGDGDLTPTDGSAHLPKPVADDHRRVLRGGSWVDDPRDLRSANRVRDDPDIRNSNIGFRPARTLLPL